MAISQQAAILRRLIFFSGIALTAGAPAFAGNLVITPTFDATVDTYFGANAAAFKSAFYVAAANFTSVYNDPIHVNISVSAAPGTGILGQSSTPINTVAFTTLRNAVSGDRTSTDDGVATGAGGSIASALSDPVGATHTYWMTRAQAKALSLLADDFSNDGTVTLGAGYTYDFDPSNGISGGAIDIVGVFMHEITEVMGRIGLSGTTVGARVNSYTLLDLFSYKGAGVRGMLNGSGNFFSIDNGTTLLKAFNNQAGLGGDSRDWASGTNDSFNAFSTSGVLNGFTPVDVRSLDVLGYDLAAPEPASMVLLGSALAGLALLRRKRVRRSASALLRS